MQALLLQQRAARAAPTSPLTNPAFPTPLLLSIATPRADRGFGVGHTRDTQTKGVWVWGETRDVADEGGRGNRTVRVAMVMGWAASSSLSGPGARRRQRPLPL